MRTRVGYTGGASVDPSYRAMGDHTEALQIDFDPEQIDYAEILALVFAGHDPTVAAYSRQYRAAVWCHDDEQLALARELGEREAARRGGALRTCVEPLRRFYRAEDYHQKWRLRRVPRLVDELVERYGSDRAMVDSTTAARLNGLIRGASRREREAVLPLLALSPAAERELLSA